MNVASWIGAGLWTASAIMVAGYTWDSYQSTFSKFPDSPPGGGITPKAVLKADASVIDNPSIAGAASKLTGAPRAKGNGVLSTITNAMNEISGFFGG